MSNNETEERWKRAVLLAEQALSCTSSQEVERWTREHLEEIDDSFFSALNQFCVVDDNFFNSILQGSLRDTTEQIAASVRATLEQEDLRRQSELLQSVLQISTFAERRERLKIIRPEITQGFFRALGGWADESPINNKVGSTLCETLLDLIELNDVREDWNKADQPVIWGSAWFAWRESPFRALIDFRMSNQPLSYDKLVKAVPSIFRSLHESGRPRLALALLNVLLEASANVVSGPPMVSRTDVFRFHILFYGAKVITLWLGNQYRGPARRLLDETQSLLKKIADEHLDGLDRLRLDGAKAEMLGLRGDLAFGEDDMEGAGRFYQQALEQSELLIARAQTEGIDESSIRQVAQTVPNSLQRLAKAQILLWQLDEAADSIARAIAECRRWRIPESELAEYLRPQAWIEFLRTNFDAAEAILTQAAQLSQEGESE